MTPAIALRAGVVDAPVTAERKSNATEANHTAEELFDRIKHLRRDAGRLLVSVVMRSSRCGDLRRLRCTPRCSASPEDLDSAQTEHRPGAK